MWPTREFDLLGQLAMVGATACALAVLLIVAGAFVFFARYLWCAGAKRKLNK